MQLNKRTHLIAVLLLSLGSGLFTPAVAQSLPAGWATAEIGAVGTPGTASGDTSAFSVDGAGADVWGTADAFRFVYTTLSGNGSITTRVTSEEYVNDWTKAGVMIRETLTPGSRHAFMLVSPGKGLAFQRRVNTNGTSLSTAGGAGKSP
jgi:hypothetical protein